MWHEFTKVAIFQLVQVEKFLYCNNSLKSETFQWRSFCVLTIRINLYSPGAKLLCENWSLLMRIEDGDTALKENKISSLRLQKKMKHSNQFRHDHGTQSRKRNLKTPNEAKNSRLHSSEIKTNYRRRAINTQHEYPGNIPQWRSRIIWLLPITRNYSVKKKKHRLWIEPNHTQKAPILSTSSHITD